VTDRQTDRQTELRWPGRATTVAAAARKKYWHQYSYKPEAESQP